MIANGMTINDAAQRWVAEMNAYPQDMIKTLINAKSDDWNEVTLPEVGDRVYIYEPEEFGAYEHSGEIISYDEESDLYCVELYGKEKKVSVSSEDFDVEYDDSLPMWGTMWSFGDSADDYWMDEMDGIKLTSKCGFRIYKHEKFGYFLGIDGAGYDFYESHWIPLYKARGLQWHDPKAEQQYH